MNNDSIHLRVDRQPQFFVDNMLIECSQALKRTWHRPQRHGSSPVIVGDRPWEHAVYFTYSNYQVRHDPADGLTKCWYEDLGRFNERGTHPMQNRLLYAVSRDGLHFEKPELDICAHDGAPTNIVMGHTDGNPATDANPWAGEGVHSASIIIDPDPPTPDDRFRMIFSRCVEGEYGWRHVSAIAHSPDGVHWRPYEQPPRIGEGGQQLGDVSVLSYDPDARVFVQCTRRAGMGNVPLPAGTPQVCGWFAPYYPLRPDLMNKRRIYRTLSHDFVHWSDPHLIVAPDDERDNLDEAFYGMGHFRVGRYHFGTLGVFRFTDNEMDVRLMFSRDGLHWQRADGERPLLTPRGVGYWDAHLVNITSPPIARGDQWWFYHGGASCHHDWWMSGHEKLDHAEAHDPESHMRYGLGVATMRREGFVSLDAGPVRRGYVVTRPLQSDGNRLVINAQCRPGGSIRASILDLEGQVVGPCTLEACDDFRGDAITHTLEWNGDPIIPQARWRRIHFELINASLFGFRFDTEE